MSSPLHACCVAQLFQELSLQLYIGITTGTSVEECAVEQSRAGVTCPGRSARRGVALESEPRDRQTRYFAIGDWVTADGFADALVAAGVDAACQLDINRSFTRFVLYDDAASGTPGGELAAPRQARVLADRYWETPSHRDYFYIAER